jgi:hypothetical protein
MMLLGGLFLHGVMRRLTISMTLCGVTFPATGAVGSMIPVANANLGPRYAVQVELVAALNTNLDDTIMEVQDLRVSKMRIRGKSKGLRQ